MVDYSGYAAINIIFAAVGSIAGWLLGDYVAKMLGYDSGTSYWLIRSSVVVGGAVLGWFAANVLIKIITKYLINNPSIIFKLYSKLGEKTFYWAVKFLGINPITLATNPSKFIAVAKLLNSKSIVLGYDWAIELYKIAINFGYKIVLHEPHGDYSWHIHLYGANGKFPNLHIQIVKSVWSFLKK